MRRPRDPLVLCYHALSEDWPAALSVTPAAFRAQIGWLVRAGYAATTFTRAALDPPPGRIVAITFDDAFRSVLDLAYPVLREAGLVASVYAPTRHIDAGSPLAWEGTDQWLDGTHARELAPLSWEELGRLADAGWEVGSHSATHPHLTRLDGEELAAELEGSRAACERALSRPCTSIAYPYGDVDDRVVAAVARAGYTAGAALPARPHSARALEYPRIGVYHGDDVRRVRLKASRVVRRVRRRSVARARPANGAR